MALKDMFFQRRVYKSTVGIFVGQELLRMDRIMSEALPGFVRKNSHPVFQELHTVHFLITTGATSIYANVLVWFCHFKSTYRSNVTPSKAVPKSSHGHFRSEIIKCQAGIRGFPRLLRIFLPSKRSCTPRMGDVENWKTKHCHQNRDECDENQSSCKLPWTQVSQSNTWNSVTTPTISTKPQSTHKCAVQPWHSFWYLDSTTLSQNIRREQSKWGKLMSHQPDLIQDLQN